MHKIFFFTCKIAVKDDSGFQKNYNLVLTIFISSWGFHINIHAFGSANIYRIDWFELMLVCFWLHYFYLLHFLYMYANTFLWSNAVSVEFWESFYWSMQYLHNWNTTKVASYQHRDCLIFYTCMSNNKGEGAHKPGNLPQCPALKGGPSKKLTFFVFTYSE